MTCDGPSDLMSRRNALAAAWSMRLCVECFSLYVVFSGLFSLILLS